MIITPGHPDFFINRKRYTEVEVELPKFALGGFFRGCALKEGEVVRSFGMEVPVPNLITNGGLDAVGSGLAWSRMHLGTGTTPPSFTDTALTTFGVNVSPSNPSVTQGYAPSSPYYGMCLYTWTSAVGGATGNWTEIGVSNQNTTGNLWSHALILDNTSSPTVFTVQADEQFQGSYELRLYAPSSDILTSITLGTNTYDTITRALRVTNNAWAPSWQNASTAYGRFYPRVGIPTSNTGFYSGGIAAVTEAAPAGTGLASTSGTNAASSYSSGSYTRDTSLSMGSGQAVGSWRTIAWRMATAELQVQLDPALTKLTTEEVIFNMRMAWARR